MDLVCVLWCCCLMVFYFKADKKTCDVEKVPYTRKLYSALLVTLYCALHRKDSLCTLVCGFCVSRKGGGGGGGGWDHLQGDMHRVAARLGCKSAIVGTRWANSAWTGLENATFTL